MGLTRPSSRGAGLVALAKSRSVIRDRRSHLRKPLPHCAPLGRRSMRATKNLARRQCGGSVKRPHRVAEQFVDAKSARQESLLDGEIDDDLKRTAIGLDAEPKPIELGSPAFRKTGPVC